MNRTVYRICYRAWGLGLLALLSTMLIWFGTAAPSQAHWADLAAAEIIVNQTDVQITLTFPTGLTSFADRDRNGQLSPAEIRSQAIALQDYMQQRIQLTDGSGQPATLTIRPPDRVAPSLTAQAAPNTHSSLLLVYSWTKPFQGLKIHYNLFLPGVSTASCLATILHNHQLKTFVFTPAKQVLTLGAGLPEFATQGGWLAIAGALLWGAVHSLSPGHGKTVVAAYLVGTRATAYHALFLALTTTVTHTIGVVALGLIALFAAHLILPEQLYPWMSLVSGLLIVAIGINLLRDRLKGQRASNRHPHAHPHSHAHHHGHSHTDAHHLEPEPLVHHLVMSQPIHSQDQPAAPEASQLLAAHSPHAPHAHSYPHAHSHAHTHHAHPPHSHLPPGADGSPVTWRNLLTLGISGGLVPCPAALVLLLSCIALGDISLGLLLVLAFSLGLAGVLTGLGLALVYAKRLFHRLPTYLRPVKALPVVSALCVTVVGGVMSTHALLQVIHLR